MRLTVDSANEKLFHLQPKYKFPKPPLAQQGGDTQ
jgi:hypothetical protein